jgi:hypothetical protein
MEVTFPSETMVDIQLTLARYIPEDTAPLLSLQQPHAEMGKETRHSNVIN